MYLRFKVKYFHIMLVLAWIVILLFSATYSHCQDLSGLYKKLKPSVVLILAHKGDSTSQGSGFIISAEGDVITNYHVIRGAISAEIKFANEEVLEVKGIVSKDEKADLVKLAVKGGGRTFQAVTLCETVQVAEDIMVIGNPLWLDFKIERVVTKGIVSQVKDSLILISADISSGSSGSPVFNFQGQVVGVASAKAKKGPLYFAVSASKVKILTSDLIDKQEIQPGRFYGAIVRPGFHRYITLPEEKAAKDTIWAHSLEGHYILGKALYSIDRFDIALPHLKKALVNRKKDPDLYAAIGDCLKRLNHNDEAIDAYKQVVFIKPDYFWAWLRLGELYNEQHQYEESAQAYEQARLIGPHKWLTLTPLAWVYHSLGKLSDMVAVLKNAILICPEYCETHKMLGNTYIELRRFDLAEKALKNAIVFSSTNPFCYMEAYSALAYLYDLLGRDEEADEAREKHDAALDSILALEPKVLRLEIEQGEGKWVEQDVSEWIDSLKWDKVMTEDQLAQAIQNPIRGMQQPPNLTALPMQICPDSSTRCLLVGMQQESEGRYEEALQKYKESTEICSVFIAGYKHLVALYSKLGRYQETRSALMDVTGIKEECLGFAWAYYRLVIISSMLGLDLETEEFLEKVESATLEACVGLSMIGGIDSVGALIPQITPDTAFKCGALGVVCEHQRDTTEAMEMYKQAIQLYPNFAEAHFLLGRSYVYSGKYPEAVEELKRLKGLNGFLADKLLDLIYPP